MVKRWIWVTAVVAGLVSAGVALGRPAQFRLTDLSVYLGAVDGLAQGSSLYDFTRGAAPFTYPPFAALVFTPLTWAPTLVVQVAWTVATLGTVAALATLVMRDRRTGIPALATLVTRRRRTASPAPASLVTRRRRTGIPALATLVTRHRTTGSAALVMRHRRTGGAAPTMRTTGIAGAVGVAALVLVVSAPVSSNLKYGQVSLFLAALCLADLLVLRRTEWNGVLIGFAAAVKLTPLIFVPLLWFSGRRRAAVTAAVTFVGCGLIGALALPGDSWRFWAGEIFHVSRLGYITGVGNQSLNGALMRLDVPDHARSVLVLAIGGGIAVAGLIRGARLAREDHWLGAAVVVGAAGVVLSPVSWTHHQVWLVPAALLPVAGPAWVRLGWPATVLAVMVLPVTALEPLSESRLLLAIVVAALIPVHDGTRIRPHEKALLYGETRR
ncbi:MAG: glycosyltransferase 87 family protein [Actinomycetota bacterium]|nr:glycosyltransferase 87 family protein [Actinomycetota bacterium]